jgi:hypothetical protein
MDSSSIAPPWRSMASYDAGRRGHPPHQFTSARHLKRLVSIDDGVANLHNLPRHAMSSSDDRALRAEAMVAWRQIAEPGIATQRQGVNRRPRREPIAFLG